MSKVSESTENALMHILAVIYKLLVELADWPTFEQFEFEVERNGLGDAGGILCELPSGYITGLSSGALPDDKQQLGLTITGLAVAAEEVPEAAVDLRIFRGTVVWASRETLLSRPPENVLIRSSELSRIVEFPAAGRNAVLARVGKFWAVNGHLWTAMSGGGDSWSASLSRRGLRHYRSVKDEADFMAAERGRQLQTVEDRRAQRPPQLAAPRVAAVAVTNSDLPAWFFLLPDKLQESTRSRVQSGHLEDAVVKGWINLSVALASLTSSDLDGAALVNQTFRGFDLAGHSPAERNRHEGYVELLRGLARIRNVHTHPGAPALTELQVAAYLLTAGVCLQWVETLLAQVAGGGPSSQGQGGPTATE